MSSRFGYKYIWERTIMSQSRRRSELSIHDAASAVLPYITTISWLQYDDDMKQARRQPKLIIPHAPMYNKLGELSGGRLVFRKRFLHDVMGECLKRGKRSWFKNDADAADWAHTMGDRMQAQCRHICQAKLKNAKWAETICFKSGGGRENADDDDADDAGEGDGGGEDGGDGGDEAMASDCEEEEEEEDKTEGASDDPGYFVGFNTELMKAWRKSPCGKKDGR